MELLTIGAFARESGLSLKALRLYADLGLLTPARTDPVTGYRQYERAQLQRAELVASLRRLGMPLARIKLVCELPPPAAAQEVRSFWADAEADAAARRDLVDRLLAALGACPPPPEAAPLRLCSAALSDRGLVRGANQDAVHAGARLVAVADGFGPRGAAASAAAVGALARLEERPAAPGGALAAIRRAFREADAAVAAARTSGRNPDTGTTLTALVADGPRLALAHIGDSRAYLLRDGRLRQLTEDDTVVRFMLAQGRITPAEAASHPRRSLLLAALDGQGSPPAQVRWLAARPGDRYLLCSDGLAVAARPGAVAGALGDGSPADAAAGLIALARRGGAPDNVTCAVADAAAA